ncbi:MAG: hypothetical protein K2N02_00395, partial [Alistipes sp.]|nr:hypothetical protein [Alistipes sp.]
SEHSEESISFDCTDVSLSLNMTFCCHSEVFSAIPGECRDKIHFAEILRLGIIKYSVCFCTRLAHFGFAEDTPARQNASELAFALAYSYL